MGYVPWLYEGGLVDEMELRLLDRVGGGVLRSAFTAPCCCA